MPLISKSQIIVLHLTKYGDSGAIVHAIDSLSGRKSFYLRGIRKSKNSAALPQFHPLNILDVVTADSPKSTLSYLREYEPLFTLNNILSNIYKRTIALFISEILYRSLKIDDSDENLFAWLRETILLLDKIEGSFSNFHLWFLVQYCSKMGFRPNNNYSLDAPLFEIVSAQYFPLAAVNEFQNSLFSTENSLLLHKLLDSTLEETLLLPMNSLNRLSMAENMIKYLSYHFGIDLKIKSLSVLHEIFV